MYSIPDSHLKCVLAVSHPAGLPTREPTSSSCELRGAGRAARAPEPLDLHQLRWELVSLLLERWETTATPCQEGHGMARTLGKQGGAQGSWQPRRDQHTNATATTSLLFLEE